MKYTPSLSLSLLVAVISLVFAGCTHTTHQSPALAVKSTGESHHVEENTGTKLPIDFQKTLSESPRHQERVEIDNAGKKISARVVYPQVDTSVPVMIVIHENKGLTDRVRQMADDIAAEGYIAVAPDLLSEFSAEQQKTSDFATPDEATQALGKLDPAQVMSDLQAVYAYATSLEAGNGKIASVGFCRGGSQSFRYATVNPELDKSFVFYGTAPTEKEAYENLQVPVIAFYGGNDERVNASIDQTKAYMDEQNIPYVYEIYEGAGHAFMRSALDPDAVPANVAAREKAFVRMLEEMKELGE